MYDAEAKWKRSNTNYNSARQKILYLQLAITLKFSVTPSFPFNYNKVLIKIGITLANSHLRNDANLVWTLFSLVFSDILPVSAAYHRPIWTGLQTSTRTFHMSSIFANSCLGFLYYIITSLDHVIMSLHVIMSYDFYRESGRWTHCAITRTSRLERRYNTDQHSSSIPNERYSAVCVIRMLQCNGLGCNRRYEGGPWHCTLEKKQRSLHRYGRLPTCPHIM